MVVPPRTQFCLGLLIVIVLFAAPMFIGLREPDLRNDEAIYSYAVERILDTGEWLTPRSIPTDEPFLEKPPLKFWIVAASIGSGLLPRDEFGWRFFDGLFGAIGFLYLFLIGRRLGGPSCGVVAVLVTFTLDPLLFEHGLRGNHMEAPVFLAYCGGIYHFARWVESETARRRHAWAVAGYFGLAFMTKFVAAFFLPVVGLLALLWRESALRTVRDGWKDWLLPVGALVLLCAPWFLYETALFGRTFWHVLFGVHVFDRFTASLDPSHLNVWHYYFSQTWREIAHAGSATLIVAGMGRLLFVAWRGKSWTARLVLLWGVVPMILISVGTSKLLHYAYPFWPPIGLAAGLAFSTIADYLDTRSGSPSGVSRSVRWTLAVAAVGLFAVSAWTAVAGPVLVEVGGAQILRNTLVLKPICFGVALLWVAQYSRSLLQFGGALLLAFFLPLGHYAASIERIGEVDHPLRAARDCISTVHVSGDPVTLGVLSASGNVLNHSYYFYFWRLGPWHVPQEWAAGEVLSRLTEARHTGPVVLASKDHGRLVSIARNIPEDAAVALRRVLSDDVVVVEQNVELLLPPPFQGCVAEVKAAVRSW